MSDGPRLCPHCGSVLPPDAPRGLCPECLLRGGLENRPRGERAPTVHIVVPLDEAPGGVPEALRTFGDYELLEQIAVGGMGVVFKARQRSLNRLVAVKMIRAGHLAREADIRRFRTEAEAAANLKHPHIVAIHEVGEHDGRHFFSMDYIEGRTLAEVAREHPLEPGRAARIVQTIAGAIAYAHGRGVLHRDLKPGNVLLDERDQPHVTDFGLAKLLEGDSELTQTGAVLGSPSYMSPEQARGQAAQVSVRSDVYALGALLYELLTNRPPFLASTPLETMKLVAESDPVAPRALNPSVPRDLETICLKCLHKEPAHRYGTAEDLAEDLARWQRHEPVQARRSSVWEQAIKWAQRHPARAGLVALSVAAPAVIIALLLFNERRVTSERNRALTNEVLALSEALRAETNALAARQNLYAADLYVAAQFVEAGQVAPALLLLENHRPKPGAPDLRGFEWRYLHDQCKGTQTRILRLSQSRVNTIAFSPDGRWFAADDGGTVRLWNARTGEAAGRVPTLSASDRTLDSSTQWLKLAGLNEELRTMGLNQALHGTRDLLLGNYADAEVALAFSPDSRVLATGDRKHFLKFWDVETRRLVGVIPETNATVAFAAGTNLAFVGVGYDVLKGASGETRLYDWSTGQHLLTLPDAGGLLAMSKDGRTLATTKVFGPVRIWDTATRRERLSFDVPAANLELLAISPNGKLVATCLHDRSQFQLWDATNGRWLAGGDDHGSPLTSLAVSWDNLEVATTSSDASVRLCNTSAAREIGRLAGHLRQVTALAYSPDGSSIAAAGGQGEVRIWDRNEARHEWPIPEILPPLVFSEDSRFLAALDGRGRPVSWKLESADFRRVTERTNLVPLFLSPTGDTLTFITRPQPNAPWQLETWDMSARTLRASVALAESDMASAPFCVSRDGRRLAGKVTHPGEVLLWETGSGRLERRFAPSTNDVGEVILSPTGQLLAAVPWGETISFWNAGTGTRVARLGFNCPTTTCLAFTPDDRTFVIGGRDNLIRLADPATGALRATLAGHSYPPSHLSVSPDGRTLASYANGTIKLWHMATGREVATLLRGYSVRSLAFTPDGRALCAPVWAPKPWVWRAPMETAVDTTRPR